MTTDRQSFRITREEWLAVPPDERSGDPAIGVSAPLRDYAYHAHHLLRDEPRTPESVEAVDHGDEGIVVRLDYLDRYTAGGAIEILTKKWRDSGPAPFRGSVAFESANSN